jgi:hypothetical protein
MQKSTIILAVGLASATVLALAYGSQESSKPPVPPPPPSQPQVQDMAGAADPDPEATGELPPGHPPIGDKSNTMGAVVPTPEDDRPALTWKAPASWTLVPNPNGMRLATYKLPHAGTDKEETELIVARAGGDVDGNVKRWIGQFDESYTLRETHKAVKGLKVTLVQIDGTYKDTMSGTPADHTGWTMLAAIVQTTGQSYFFKVIGPSATVTAAAKPFDAMIDAITPAA